MQVKHIDLQANTNTHVKLARKTGQILVKNLTEGDLLVSINKEDFTENYVKIPPMTGEVLFENNLQTTSKPYYFDDVYLTSTISGEVEIRSLTL